MAQRKGCLIGCGVALVVGIGFAAALLFGVSKVVDVADKTLVDPKVFTEARVGDPEDQVRGKLPSGESFVKEALKEGGPAEPAGSTCAWYLSTDDGGKDVLRFCFKDGKLADKAEYRMK
ncbi:hypothetical protein ACIP46_14880 [Streptomyces lavendulae]|uniref:hypothetical protein n=1 Tax=Streptomyces lavendulae TaxID=1914 RepID=UPI00249FA8E9|nr:hypothetical protein [Streptomyces lavendulae]GLV97884.1 hypothetical protein Slala05_15160 [Streptomyces lavendulae subsp. lavendulae]